MVLLSYNRQANEKPLHYTFLHINRFISHSIEIILACNYTAVTPLLTPLAFIRISLIHTAYTCIQE